MAGWIKIHRDIATHWIFQDAEKFKWWIDLLLMASFEDNKALVGDRLVEVKRGQQIISLSFLASRWGASKRTVLKFLTLLESDGMCNRCTHQKVTILTICNYESYQEVETPKVTDEVTDKYPIGNRLVTELKNVEECKEIYNNNSNAHTYTREEDAESAYAEKYRQENRWVEAAMSSHLKVPEVQHIFDEFLVEQSHNSTRHLDYPDFKRHFLNYLRVKAEIIRKQKKQDNGNSAIQDKRRGVQVVANRVEDYEGSF